MIDLSRPTRNMLVKTETNNKTSLGVGIVCVVSDWDALSCVDAASSSLLASVVSTSDPSPTGIDLLRGVVDWDSIVKIDF